MNLPLDVIVFCVIVIALFAVLSLLIGQDGRDTRGADDMYRSWAALTS
jgi:hypothetical protein